MIPEGVESPDIVLPATPHPNASVTIERPDTVDAGQVIDELLATIANQQREIAILSVRLRALQP